MSFSSSRYNSTFTRRTAEKETRRNQARLLKKAFNGWWNLHRGPELVGEFPDNHDLPVVCRSSADTINYAKQHFKKTEKGMYHAMAAILTRACIDLTPLPEPGKKDKVLTFIVKANIIMQVELDEPKQSPVLVAFFTDRTIAEQVVTKQLDLAANKQPNRQRVVLTTWSSTSANARQRHAADIVSIWPTLRRFCRAQPTPPACI